MFAVDGKLKIDADLGMSSAGGGRMKNQTPSQSKVSQAKEKDSNFDEKIKKRNFTNARVQGKAWLDGFGSIKKLESDFFIYLRPKLLDNVY